MVQVDGIQVFFAQLNGADASQLNLALVTPDTGECIHPNQCYVPLDSGPGGWHAENGEVKLPGFVCKLLESKNLQLHHTIGCAAKKESNIMRQRGCGGITSEAGMSSPLRPASSIASKADSQ